MIISLSILTACGEKNEPVAQKKTPNVQKKEPVQTAPPAQAPIIPNLKVDQLLKMSKNERQELERRCLGVSHPTCSELKGDGFRKMMDLEVSYCKSNAARKGLYDRSEGAREERKCNEMF